MNAPLTVGASSRPIPRNRTASARRRGRGAASLENADLVVDDAGHLRAARLREERHDEVGPQMGDGARRGVIAREGVRRGGRGRKLEVVAEEAPFERVVPADRLGAACIAAGRNGTDGGAARVAHRDAIALPGPQRAGCELHRAHERERSIIGLQVALDRLRPGHDHLVPPTGRTRHGERLDFDGGGARHRKHDRGSQLVRVDGPAGEERPFERARLGVGRGDDGTRA